MLDVLGHARSGAGAREQDRGGDEAGHQEVDVRQPADADRTTEHVAEDQQEEGTLDGADHDELGRAHELSDRAEGDGDGAGCEAGAGSGGDGGGGGHGSPFGSGGGVAPTVLGLGGVDGLAGEGEEHLVERRTA